MSKADPIFGAIVCGNCGSFTMCYKEDYEDDPDFFGVNCDCGSTNDFVPASNMADPDFFIRAIEDELENANHHSFVDLPSELYTAITKSIKLNFEQKLKIAKTIYNEFYKSI